MRNRQLKAPTHQSPDTWEGRSTKPFNPVAKADLRLFSAVLQGQHVIQGLRNFDVREPLGPGNDKPATKLKRDGARVGRQIKRLHLRRLIAKIRARAGGASPTWATSSWPPPSDSMNRGSPMPSLALPDTDRLTTDGHLRKKRRRCASRIYAHAPAALNCYVSTPLVIDGIVITGGSGLHAFESETGWLHGAMA